MSEKEKNKELEAEQTAAPQEPEVCREEAEPASEKSKAKRKKEKGVTFTREQAEQMEQAVQQLETVKDQFTRLAAEYDNYRKRILLILQAFNSSLSEYFPQRIAFSAVRYFLL